MHADLVLLNGHVITVDDAQPAAEAVSVLGNRIIRVGASAEIRDDIGPNTRTIDLGGRALLPGFNDNHNHPMSFGEALSGIDASPSVAPTLAKLQDAFRVAADSTSDGDWLIARGYDDSRLDIHRHPTRQELDVATGGRPALLVRTCGHLAVANTAALGMADIGLTTPDPSGGQIDRDASGEPVGLLRETAIKPVRDVVPPPTVSRIKDHLRAAGQ